MQLYFKYMFLYPSLCSMGDEEKRVKGKEDFINYSAEAGAQTLSNTACQTDAPVS